MAFSAILWYNADKGNHQAVKSCPARKRERGVVPMSDYELLSIVILMITALIIADKSK